MWVIELNFAGHQFTHSVHDRRRPLFRLHPRAFGRRPMLTRRARAA